ncbi:cation:proton antiporter regulatory subunit [Pedobacter jejuensis]|uniref:cation:proton antiporter regulatory subunit n=1 Tax=Pedobacter jejuensis TaxID=1268550 RepID=UPI001FC9EDC8|nr:TrkA C-terminal domain-containing protein [Pedobacter jejuensis]
MQGIREKAQALIVGIERGADRILNPSSDFVFDSGDVIWIVGNNKKIKEVI